MLTENDMLGIWGTDNFGGQSEEDIIFFPDGRGAIDYYNPGFAGREEFHWQLLDQGTRLRFEPALWVTDTVYVWCFKKEGRRILRLEFDYPANDVINSPAGHSCVDYCRREQKLSDYSPPNKEPS